MYRNLDINPLKHNDNKIVMLPPLPKNNARHSVVEVSTTEYSSICVSIVMATVVGSGGNITILLSLCFSGLMSRLRYIFLSVLLIVCTLYDLIWCPLEIYRLIHHHHSPHDVGSDVKFAGQCMFISLFTGLFCSLLTVLLDIFVIFLRI
jgi:hypothetical protein